MKKDLTEILNNVTANTPIEKLIAYCDNTEDLEKILRSLPAVKGFPPPLSAPVKQAALILIAGKLNKTEITTADIQKNLRVTYPQAAAILEFIKK